MITYEERFKEIAEVLLAGALDSPAGLMGPCGGDGSSRFDVYRNNVYSGLISALTSVFPVTRAVVGSSFFQAMTYHFVIRNPPRSAVLLKYGDAYPSFIRLFEPCSSLPYLADVASIEWARVRAYHSADERTLEATDLLKVSPALYGDLKFRIHSSVYLVRSQYSAFSIVKSHYEGNETVISNTTPEDAMIMRPIDTVRMQLLAAGEYEFVGALVNGHHLDQATSTALSINENFDVVGTIAKLLSAGTIADFYLTPEKNVHE